MSLSFDAVTILVILLPGFLCARIFQWLCVRPEQSEMDKVVEALLFSFLVYVSFMAVFGKVQLTRKHALWLFLLSVIIAVISSTVWKHDWLGAALRKAHVTNRTSRPSVWNDVFDNYGGYALVELADGRLVLGWIHYFSDHPPAALFLRDAAWVTSTGERLQLDGPGILITSECGIKTVSFHYPRISGPADNVVPVADGGDAPDGP
jgi:hypothetical protein